MNILTRVLIASAGVIMASNAYCLDPKKCFGVTHGDKLLYDYEFPGYSSIEYLSKKHGTTGGIMVSSIQNTVSIIDPSVTTGRLLSSAQFSTTSEGGCSYYSLNKARRMEYLARNGEDVLEHIALGDGEHIRSLFYFHGCDTKSFDTFREVLQLDYPNLREIDSTAHLDEQMESIMRLVPTLAQSCILG